MYTENKTINYNDIQSIIQKNFGWIGDGEPVYDSMLSFFEDEFDSIAQTLNYEQNLYRS